VAMRQSRARSVDRLGIQMSCPKKTRCALRRVSTTSTRAD
jgi:hypothetical protein